jgi:sugar phosphate isomerase/epimerase
MKEILKRVQVHIPFHYLHQKREAILKEGINPEIGFSSADLDHFRKEDFSDVGRLLLENGRAVTLHAPFMDLRPGAIDPRIRQVSIDRLNQLFDLVPCFKPKAVVCHPSFDERYYVVSGPMWLENSVDTWRKILSRVVEMDTMITLENVYETEPDYIGLLLDAFESPRLRFCFDTGHYNVFSRADLKEWMDRLGPCLGQLHLHDNDGSMDEHLPAGEGNFPFPILFAFLRDRGISPIITIEPHSEKNLWNMLANLKNMKLLDCLME